MCHCSCGVVESKVRINIVIIGRQLMFWLICVYVVTYHYNVLLDTVHNCDSPVRSEVYEISSKEFDEESGKNVGKQNNL